jgi:hypothetical protein
MAEIVGVAATAAQLAMACLSLMDFVKKIKGGTSTLEKYHQQLQELKGLSTSISKNPLLQTPEIGLQTEAILSIINNNCLLSLRHKSRLLRTWGFLLSEQDLLEDFTTLERRKTSLSLIVEQIQCRALYEIQADIRIMADRKLPSPPTADPLAVVPHTQEADKSQVSSGSSTSSQTMDDAGSLDPNIAKLIAAYVPAFGTGPKYDTKASMPEQSDKQSSSPKKGPRWNNMVAGPGFEQENRNLFILTSELSQRLAEKPQSPCIHNGPVKLGRGNQINGHIVEYVGDVRGAIPLNLDRDEWNNGVVLPFPSSDHGNQGSQINGMEIRVGGWKRDEGNKD